MQSDRKPEEPYDLTHMWDTKLKATNKEDKQKLTDMDSKQ